MGQHKTNPVALAAKRGELGPRDKTPKTAQGGTLRSALEIVDVFGKPKYALVGKSIVRRQQKVRGKAAVKAAKKARISARENVITRKAA